jgi:hypothetical protein
VVVGTASTKQKLQEVTITTVLIIVKHKLALNFEDTEVENGD